MLKNLLLTGAGAILLVCAVYGSQADGKITINNPKTRPNNGPQMFTSYCAPCHGVDGKGRGPVAAALKSQPADLTVLSRNNQGKFPSAHVVTVLQYGSELPAHGSKDMPIWGPLFDKMNQANPQERELRISNLSRYLESIQAK
jgi:mono/diheme cytochrome c family protein